MTSNEESAQDYHIPEHEAFQSYKQQQTSCSNQQQDYQRVTHISSEENGSTVDDLKIDYGKLNKRIVFTENDYRHAQLIIRLRSDGLRQSDFFRHIVSGYVSGDERIQTFVDDIKEQSIKRKEKSKKLRKKGSKTMKDLGLNESEVENIFDPLAQEHPEL